MSDTTLLSTPEAGIIQLRATEYVLEAAGVATHYWEYGPESGAVQAKQAASAKSAQTQSESLPQRERGTIVAIHGFRGDHHGLEAVIAQLPHEHVIAPDLPGFGASPAFPFRPHDLDGYVSWLQDFLRALAPVGPVTLLGHSFGSIVVAAAVSRGVSESAGRSSVASTDHVPSPNAGVEVTPTVASVILINPIGAPALKGPRAIGTFVAVAYYKLGAWLPEGAGLTLLRNRLVVRIMSQMMAKTSDPRLRAWIHRQHGLYFSAFATRRSVLEAFQASVSHDVSEFAAALTQPTLLIAAEKDDITPLAAQYRLAGLFPHAQLEVIPEVGHLIHYEAADQAARFVTGFLHETNAG